MDRFQEAKLLVKERVDLVDLVQVYVPLKRRGRHFVGLCPFHAEKTPSFAVFPESQHYRCFGCGVSGDVFSFVQEREGISFRDAMEQLAERARVSLDGVFGQKGAPGEGRAKGPDVHEALSAVRDLFEETLYADEGSAARGYLDQRGLLDAAEAFGLGAHPPAGRLRAFAESRKLPRELLDQAGVLRRDGREPMEGRVMFPIADERGKVVGFGGRVLPDPRIPKGEDPRPKYLNSPEAPFFNKRRLLYGLRHVKQAGQRRIVVVEGYTDVIACHLAGFTGAVAALGTALTRDHARLLERWATDGVVLLFDGDQAGRRAADRAFRELVNTNLPVRIGLLPEGKDPADLAAVVRGIAPEAAQASRRELQELIDGADDALTVWFRLIRRSTDLSVVANVTRVADECGRILAEVDLPARREPLRQRMAMHLGISESALRVPELRRARPADAPGPAPPVRPRPVRRAATPLEHNDLDLVACILAEPSLVSDLSSLPGQSGASASRVLSDAERAVQAGRADSGSLVRDLFARYTEDAEIRAFLADAQARASRVRDARSMFTRLRRDREIHCARQEAERTKMLLRQALAAGDSARADELTRKFQDLVRRSSGATSD